MKEAEIKRGLSTGNLDPANGERGLRVGKLQATQRTQDVIRRGEAPWVDITPRRFIRIDPLGSPSTAVAGPFLVTLNATDKTVSVASGVIKDWASGTTATIGGVAFDTATAVVSGDVVYLEYNYSTGAITLVVGAPWANYPAPFEFDTVIPYPQLYYRLLLGSVVGIPLVLSDTWLNGNILINEGIYLGRSVTMLASGSP